MMSTKRTRALVVWTLAFVLSAAGLVACGAKHRSDLFATSAYCIACHSGMVAPDGTDVSFGTDWRASMMANAARDPYWQAAVRRDQSWGQVSTLYSPTGSP